MKQKFVDMVIAFVLVMLACYAAINVDQMIGGSGCQPVQLATEHGKKVLLSVCKTPLKQPVKI